MLWDTDHNIVVPGPASIGCAASCAPFMIIPQASIGPVESQAPITDTHHNEKAHDAAHNYNDNHL